MPILAKDQQTRVDDTIEYIVNNPDIPRSERSAVRGWLTDKVTAATATPDTLREYSGRLSTSGCVRSTEDQRAMRRSIIMLNGFQANPPGAEAVRQLPTARLAPRLEKLLYGLRMMADQDRGSQSLLQKVFVNFFRADPLSFLRRERIMIPGTPQNSGPQNVADLFFFYDMGRLQFKIDRQAPPGAAKCHAIRAVSVPAIVWADVPGRTNVAGAGSFATIPPTVLDGAEVMLSTQFSGCSFCFKAIGAAIHAAHIMPDDGERVISTVGLRRGGERMARQLDGQDPNVTAGDFAAPNWTIAHGVFANVQAAAPNAAPFRVYGAGYSNVPGMATGYPPRDQIDQYMSIIGFRRNGIWRIYSQHVLGDTLNAYQVH